MKITIKRRELSAALATVTRAISARSTMPITHHVRLVPDANTGRLTLSATDLELWMDQTIPVTIETTLETFGGGDDSANANHSPEDAEVPYGYCLPGKHLAGIIAATPDNAQITLSHTSPGSTVELSWGTGSVKMQHLPVDDFPGHPTIEKEATTVFPMIGSVIAQMIRLTRFACGTDMTRANLMGLCFNFEKKDGQGKLEIVGTDTHRMAVISRPCDFAGTGRQIIVPTRYASEIMALGKGDEEMQFTATPAFLMCKVGDLRIATRLIDGQYPNYQRIIPPRDEYGSGIIVERQHLADIIRRAGLVVADNANRATLRTDGSILSITGKSGTSGSFAESMEAVTTGEGICAAVNCKFAFDMLNAVSCDGLRFQQESGLRPFRVEPTEHEGDDAGYLHILMPMRIAEGE